MISGNRSRNTTPETEEIERSTARGGLKTLPLLHPVVRNRIRGERQTGRCFAEQRLLLRELMASKYERDEALVKFLTSISQNWKAGSSWRWQPN